MPVLSKEDLAFWEENGYVVVKEAVPQENLAAMVDVIWAFLEIDREQWYKYKPYTREDRCSPISAAGMVEIYQHQALWDNRQYPKVHQAFAEIWGDEKLWVSVDRANMKPPARADRPEWCNEGMIHWDADTSKQPVPFGVQGVLYLTDTAEDQGGFQYVAGAGGRGSAGTADQGLAGTAAGAQLARRCAGMGACASAAGGAERAGKQVVGRGIVELGL